MSTASATPAPPAVPVDPYLAMLSEWEDVAGRMAALKEREEHLRRMLFAGAFPNPKEGTQTHVLPDGRKVKGQYKINRRVDEAALPAVLEQMRADGVPNADALVKYKPELAKSIWNGLTDEQKLTFSRALVSSPGLPALELIPAPVKDA